MADFREALAEGRFLITTEEPPPKGSDVAAFFRRTRKLAGLVDGINLTESSAAVMAMSPAGLVPGLVEQGHTPILQITCRDRNRIALQAEVLAAATLGATAVVAMSGDPIEGGDHPGATGVYDVDTPGLLHMLSKLDEGSDLAGNRLQGGVDLCLGAVVNPGAEDLDREIAWMEQKVEAGATFFQTQAVYNPDAFEGFMRRVEHLGVPVIATFIVPKSGDMARRMNRSVPGVQIPDEIIRRLDAAPDRRECAIEVSGPILRGLAETSRGIHLIAVGWEDRFPAILTAAGIDWTSK